MCKKRKALIVPTESSVRENEGRLTRFIRDAAKWLDEKRKKEKKVRKREYRTGRGTEVGKRGKGGKRGEKKERVMDFKYAKRF